MKNDVKINVKIDTVVCYNKLLFVSNSVQCVNPFVFNLDQLAEYAEFWH